MTNCLGRFLVVPGSLGVPQHALAQCWKVAQSKYRKSSFRCRIENWSADVSFTDHSWLEHRARQASSRKSLAVGKVFAEFGCRGKLFPIITIIAGTASRKKRSSRNCSSRDMSCHNHHHRHHHHHHPHHHHRHLRGNSLAEEQIIAGITHRRFFSP